MLASIVSGFAWYFTNHQVNNFNIKQQELIERVEKDEVLYNCKRKIIQSKKFLTIRNLRIGIAKKLILMESSRMADFLLNAIAESNKDTSFLLLSLSAQLTMKTML